MIRSLLSTRLHARQLPRLVRLLSSEQPQRSVSKEALSKLRKATGYSYTNCRKALLQFGDENLAEAERWLRELAKKEGWAKATKLSSRQTSQGLVGVVTEGNVGVIVELNCETDFVGRSADFKQLVEEISYGVLDWAKSKPAEKKSGEIVELTSVSTENDEIQTRKGRPLKEAVALTVGKLGENISIARIEVARSDSGVELHGHAHPNPKDSTSKVPMGQFASILALVRDDPAAKFPSAKSANHIIGMRPESLGSPPSEKEMAEAVEPKAPISAGASKVLNEETDELNDFADVQGTQINDESELLRQSFMLNPAQSVHEYLSGHGARVLWFVRKELGEQTAE
ncbi:Elongation factor Ts, mitochondrial [Aphelenchoides fujianensis]|nr:Elongation factor Ts, mitochondrial [Aphelenchoides fujianensis]